MLIVSSATSSVVLVSTPAAAQVREVTTTSRRRVIGSEITPRLRLSVSRGFAQLLRAQRKSNSFRSNEFPVAENALMGLAFLAGGYTDSNGPKAYVEALKLNTHTLLSYQKPNGYFDDGKSQMYGHGFATLFLAELYGMSGTQNEKLRKALQNAVRLIEKSQIKGGWDYSPGGLIGRLAPYGGGDTSITVCQTFALRAAQNLGVVTDKSVVKSAKSFILRAQNTDGGFGYRVAGKMKIKEHSEFPRSAAGVCVLYSLGDYRSSEIQDGVRYLLKNYRARNDFPHYAQYYCSQAMFQVGGRHWREYFAWASQEIIGSQRNDGSWGVGNAEGSGPARTAMSLIVLQIPYRFLPIHQR
jgi:hypothetical protein